MLKLSWLHRSLKTLNKLQNLGIKHEDICDQNIVLNAEDRLVLLDFGKVTPYYPGDLTATKNLFE